MDLEQTPGLEPQLCHFLAVWPQASYLISLFLSFLIYKMGIMLLLILMRFNEFKFVKCLEQCLAQSTLCVCQIKCKKVRKRRGQLCPGQGLCVVLTGHWKASWVGGRSGMTCGAGGRMA